MGFSSDYTIERISYQMAMELVVSKHYLHRRAPVSMAFGMFDLCGQLVGVVTYGVPASSTLLKGVCGEEEAANVYELNRLWVDDSVPKNGESYLIGNTLDLVDKEIIVSYADTSQDHIGTVYQATNWIYTGMSAKFRDPKVKGLESQHHATYAHGLSNKQVIEKFGDQVYFVERPRKHRYVFLRGSKSRRKELLKKLKWEPKKYPKKSFQNT